MSDQGGARVDAANRKGDAAASTAESEAGVQLAEQLSSMDDATLMRVLEESRIVIRPGGQVVIENLTAGLLEVAVALNPDAVDLTCRLDDATPNDAADDSNDTNRG